MHFMFHVIEVSFVSVGQQMTGKCMVIMQGCNFYTWCWQLYRKVLKVKWTKSSTFSNNLYS